MDQFLTLKRANLGPLTTGTPTFCPPNFKNLSQKRGQVTGIPVVKLLAFKFTPIMHEMPCQNPYKTL